MKISELEYLIQLSGPGVDGRWKIIEEECQKLPLLQALDLLGEGDTELVHPVIDRLLCFHLEDKFPGITEKYKSLTLWYA